MNRLSGSSCNGLVQETIASKMELNCVRKPQSEWLLYFWFIKNQKHASAGVNPFITATILFLEMCALFLFDQGVGMACLCRFSKVLIT